jgi:hypothetical protein
MANKYHLDTFGTSFLSIDNWYLPINGFYPVSLNVFDMPRKTYD